MKVRIDPSVETKMMVARLYNANGRIIGTAIHQCVPDGEGGWRPAADVTFEIEEACQIDHAIVCGRKMTARRKSVMEPGDTFNIELTVVLHRFEEPFTDREV